MQLGLAKLAPSLAAGCTVVLKGAPDTPIITNAIGELIQKYTDIPAGVVNILSSSGIPVGEVLTTHPDVDVVTFTGSTPVGAQIMAAAAATMKKVFTELGGKSALIVLEDADLATVAQFAAFSICSHAGQGCALTSRLLVPRDKHDEIVQAIATMMANVPFGDPTNPKMYMGPLISAKQRDKVDGLVQRAIAAGATLAAGGKAVSPGYFYEPTLVANVDPSSEIAQEEAFGPVLAVIPFDDEEDAVRIANDSKYGLSGGILTADDDRGIAIARRIRTGSFGINGGNYFSPICPSAATSSRASAAKWARKDWRSSSRPSRTRWRSSREAAGRGSRPRGRDVRVRSLCGCSTCRVGRRRHQGRARRHR